MKRYNSQKTISNNVIGLNTYGDYTKANNNIIFGKDACQIETLSSLPVNIYQNIGLQNNKDVEIDMSKITIPNSFGIDYKMRGD